MLDVEATLQQEALGIVGVNLLYGAFFMHQTPEKLLEPLLDNPPAVAELIRGRDYFGYRPLRRGAVGSSPGRAGARRRRDRALTERALDVVGCRRSDASAPGRTAWPIA